jgi:hypothetical protein
MRSASRVILLSAVFLCLRGQAQAGNGRFKVFILAGQSNMEGKGSVEIGNGNVVGAIGSLRHMVANDWATYGSGGTRPLVNNTLAEVLDTSITSLDWVTRDDVWIYSTTDNGEKGYLTTGFGSGDAIGPEYAFGQVMGDLYDDPVVLIKTAWGGKSLAGDFRPPSAVADRGGTVGAYYNLVLQEVGYVLQNMGNEHPEYVAQGIDIVGFGWHQGWNDLIDGARRAEYEENMADFISDIRDDLNAPDLPFVIAASGFGGANANSNVLTVLNAQMAMADANTYPEFEGNVAAVDTRDFWREANVSPKDEGYHWNRNAETYYLMGDAMGEAIATLDDATKPFYPLADLNLDEVVSELDWPIFLAGNHTDLSGLTPEQAYLMGDLDGDGDSDIDDFGLFSEAYDSANGAGAFAEMVASYVPEPGSVLLLACGAAGLAIRRKRRFARAATALVVMAGVLAVMGGAVRAASPIIYEPFDYAAGNITNKDGGVGFDGPWASNVRNGNVVADNLEWGILQNSGGHMASNAWSAPYRPIGSTLLDAGLLNNGSTLWFSYVEDIFGQNMTNLDYCFALTTAPFDSVYATKQELKGANQEGIGVSNWRADVYGAYWQDNGDADTTSERTHVDTGLNLDAGAFSRVMMVGKIEWGATSGDNERLTLYTPAKDLELGAPLLDAWETAPLDQAAFDTLAIQWKDSTAQMDEIRFGATLDDVLGEKPILTLQVDPITGDTKILGNDVRTVEINYYQITSEGSSLDSNSWVSLQDQDFEGGGGPSGYGDGWEEAGGADSGALAEAYLLGTSTISAAQEIGLGKGFDPNVNVQDLAFRYRVMPGVNLEGIVEYVTSVKPGDANLDNVVDAADYLALKGSLGTGAGAKYGDGDFDLDGDVDWADLQVLLGGLSQGGAAATIPEPATLAMLLCGSGWLLRRRKARA